MKTSEMVNTARMLAVTFASLKEVGVTDRAIYNGILRATAEQHSQFLGVWSVWEPNALDGSDDEFIDAPGHDSTGRFIPLWCRTPAGIHLEPNTNYDEAGPGDWYLVPTRRGEEMVIDPYEFTVSGRRMFITSRVAPIFYKGRVVGAAGIDLAVDSFPEPLHGGPMEEILNRGYIFLTPTGKVEYWTPRTRDLIIGYFPGQTGMEAGGDPRLPMELQRHVRRLASFAARQNPAVVPALMAPLTIVRGSKQLIIRFVEHPYSSRYLMLVEEREVDSRELSTREREVLEWIGEGKSNGEIAIILGISLHTVKRHVERIFAKLGVENRHAAARYASSNKAGADSHAARIGPQTYTGKGTSQLSATA